MTIKYWLKCRQNFSSSWIIMMKEIHKSIICSYNPRPRWKFDSYRTFNWTQSIDYYIYRVKMFKVIFWLLKKRARFKLVFPISVHLLWTRFLGILNSIVMHGHCDYLMPKLMHGHNLVCNLDHIFFNSLKTKKIHLLSVLDCKQINHKIYLKIE